MKIKNKLELNKESIFWSLTGVFEPGPESSPGINSVYRIFTQRDIKSEVVCVLYRIFTFPNLKFGAINVKITI